MDSQSSPVMPLPQVDGAMDSVVKDNERIRNNGVGTLHTEQVPVNTSVQATPLSGLNIENIETFVPKGKVNPIEVCYDMADTKLSGTSETKESSECTDHESVESEDTIMDCVCQGCNKTLTYGDDEWVTCTICMTVNHEYGTSMMICTPCYQSGFHSEHDEHTAKFHPHRPEYDGGWCDACGTELGEPDRLIYMCTKCEKDQKDYGLCKKCYRQRYHSTHRDYLKKQKVSDLWSFED